MFAADARRQQDWVLKRPTSLAVHAVSCDNTVTDQSPHCTTVSLIHQPQGLRFTDLMTGAGAVNARVMDSKSSSREDTRMVGTQRRVLTSRSRR